MCARPPPPPSPRVLKRKPFNASRGHKASSWILPVRNLCHPPPPTPSAQIPDIQLADLYSPAALLDESLHRGREVSPSKPLLHRLLASHDRDGEQVLVDLAVEFQDLVDLFHRLLASRPSRVTLLPQELTGAQEWLRVLEFPPLLMENRIAGFYNVSIFFLYLFNVKHILHRKNILQELNKPLS